MDYQQAIAIKTKMDRYFFRIIDNRVNTTHKLANAKLFADSNSPELTHIEIALKAKKYKTQRVIIGELPAEHFHKQKTIFQEIESQHPINSNQ